MPRTRTAYIGGWGGGRGPRRGGWEVELADAARADNDGGARPRGALDGEVRRDPCATVEDVRTQREGEGEREGERERERERERGRERERERERNQCMARSVAAAAREGGRRLQASSSRSMDSPVRRTSGMYGSPVYDTP